MRNIKILSMGSYIPENQVFSAELEKTHNLPSGWIEEHTGIKKRQYLDFEKENMIDAGVKAAKQSLDNAGLKLEDIDCIISSSASKFRPIPCTASFFLKELGSDKHHATCFDVDLTCLSFVAALDFISYAIAAGRYKNVLIISSECGSRGINWNQKESAALIGDAAVAAVIRNSKVGESSKILFAKINNFTEGIEFTTVRGGLMHLTPLEYTGSNKEDFLFDMNGKSAYRVGAKFLPKMVEESLVSAGISIEDIKMVIPHQASMMSIKLMLAKLNIPQEKIMYIIQDYGNNVAASIPLALKIAVDEKKVKRGDKVMLLGTSAGLSVGIMILEY